jgi:hypothetical protein
MSANAQFITRGAKFRRLLFLTLAFIHLTSMVEAQSRSTVEKGQQSVSVVATKWWVVPLQEGKYKRRTFVFRCSCTK